MVELGVPCVSFKKPDPDKPQSHFVGLPANRFTAIDAENLYKQMIRKERDARSTVPYIESRMRNTADHESRLILGDCIPGYTSLGQVHRRLGYTTQLNNGQVVPPAIKNIQEAAEGPMPDMRQSLSNFGMTKSAMLGSSSMSSRGSRPGTAASASTCKSSLSRRELPRSASEPGMGSLRTAGATFATTKSHADMIKAKCGARTLRFI
mmetsp:Transcript_65120/g.146892  ORF Transcript_65120/g.146892 Transcript_65120/m.146892 type:complete len:207 (-) Transcript_65120:50-670(-)